MSEARRRGTVRVTALAIWLWAMFGAASVARATVTVSPSPFPIGSVAIGSNGSGSATVNTDSTLGDDVDLDVGSGSDCADFVISPDSDIVVGSNAPVAIVGTFTPSARRAESCTVTIVDSLSQTSLGTFNITGTGVAPVISTSTPTVPNTRVNGTNPVTFTITNSDATQTLDVSGMTFATGTDYTLVSPTGAFTVGPNSTKPVTLSFSPTASGTRTDTLTIASNAFGDANHAVALSGVGTNATIEVSDVNFNIVQDGLASPTKATTTIKNHLSGGTGGPLTVTAATLNDTSGWFSFDAGDNCTLAGSTCNLGTNIVVASGASTTFGIDCQPPADASGTMTATVTFISDSDNGTGFDNVANLSCTGGKAQIVTVPAPPTVLQFGNVTVGGASSLSIDVKNTGNETLSYSFAQTGAAYTVTSAACTASAPCTIAAAAADKTITVEFQPTAQGDATGVITLTTNDPDNPTIAISLDGNGVQSLIAATPSPLAFGNVEVGANQAEVLKVTNTGNVALNISSATLSTSATDFTVSAGSTGVQSVPAGGSTTWTIVCTPTAASTRPGTFTIANDSSNSPSLVVPLNCVGLLGQLVVTPTPFNFGNVRQGDTASQSFTLKNSGNTTVTGITGPLTTAGIGYTITQAPPTTLAGGGSATVTVQFSPQSSGDGGPDSIIFTGSWGSAPVETTTAELDINGTDQQAGYDVSTTMLAYGNIRWDQNASASFTVQLTDSAPVKIETIDIAPATGTMTGEFSQGQLKLNGTNVSLPITLSQATDQLVVPITAAPADRVGSMQATITVHSDLAMNPDRTVTATATSVSPELTLDPAGGTLSFGAVDIAAGSVQMPITITNSGSGVLNLGAMQITSSGSAFTFAPPSQGATTLQPGDTSTITVTYAPTQVETDTATVIVPLIGILNGPSNATINISGSGVTRHFTVASNTLTFPDTFVYPDTPPTMPVHVTNTGGATLHVSMSMISGDSAFSLSSSDSSQVAIAAGDSHDFIVTFDPIVAGPAPTGTLSMTNDDTTDPVAEITLNGSGIDRAVSMGPSTIDLGITSIGIPRLLSEISPDALLVVTSMDPTNTFTIKALTIDQGPFTVVNPPTDQPLAADATASFDIEFAPTEDGTFTATLSLLLDDDPNPRAQTKLVGEAVFVDARGGGGCNAGGGGGAGAGALLGLALAAMIANHRRARARARVTCTLGATATAALALAGTAHADPTRSLDVTVFDPTPSVTGESFAVQPATIGDNGNFALSALFSYAQKPLDLATSGADDFAISNRTLVDLGGAYAFGDRFELGAHMPLYVQSGDPDAASATMFGDTPASGTARGDLGLAAKARLVGVRDSAIQLGIAGALSLPTASSEQFAGPDAVEGRALVLATLTPPRLENRLVVSINAGAAIRGHSQFANIDEHSGAAWGVGATYRLLAQLWLDGEVYGEYVHDGIQTAPATGSTMPGKAALDPVEALFGIHYQVQRATAVGFALGRGVDDAFGTPALRGVLDVTFVSGQRALSPLHPPEPPKPDGDADGDGIPDSRDKCPNEPEDKDGFQDEDGCPDLDNDHDGIPDTRDKCPLVPEDKDGFEDEDGCPDDDNDRDGIPDSKDKCPNQPEDKDGFQDEDGCPDPDNDHDGIPDTRDKCPNQPETINGYQDDDGCPDAGDPLVVVSPDRLELLDSVRWDRVKIAKRSYNLLGQIAATLRAHDEILRLRVTSYVQPSGNADADLKETQKRAEAIRDWLVQWGIVGSRLEAKGFGGSKPLMDPEKRGAAQLNDRIELIILDRK